MDMKAIEETRFTVTNDPADADYRLITLRLPASAGPGHGTVDLTGAQAMQEIARFALAHAGAIVSSIGHTTLGQDLQHMAAVIHERLP